MMISRVAISAEIVQFRNERVLDADWARKFPGALWMPVFAEKMSQRGIKVTTGDVALSHVKQGYWTASDIGVIQHLDDSQTEELIKLGAHPLILTAFESPLYVPQFYKNVKLIAPKFNHRIMFSGLFEFFKPDSSKNHFVRFPAYNNNDIHAIVPWKDRGFMVMIVGNKYELPFSKYYLKNLQDILRLTKRFASLIIKGKITSLFDFKNFSYKQLQDIRLSAIIFFGSKNLLKLYGKSWGTLSNLPIAYQKKLIPLLENLNPEPCQDKHEISSHYKYALCFENASFPGYVTEKVIDCFVAGVIPIYNGAPNIEDFIPANSFINVRNYKSWEALLEKLNSITESEAMQMIDNGRLFLGSETGQLHSYNGFASFVEKLVIQELKGT
ncbi:MAG TPA: hypothetical protein DIT07_12430 [Sphingobacteriaceae bacterium]|nr:hypothetical protein [Sphingobacteriaceae bacterium]